MSSCERRWAPTQRRPYNVRALTVCIALVASTALATPPAQPKLSPADKRALAERALQWAIAGGIDDFKLVKDPSNLIASDANLPLKAAVAVPGRKVTLLSPRAIQSRADKEGDFLYFRFDGFSFNRGGFSVNKFGQAEVSIALVWAVSVHSTAHYLSGGGATLTFEKHNGKWQLLPVANRWMS